MFKKIKKVSVPLPRSVPRKEDLLEEIQELEDGVEYEEVEEEKPVVNESPKIKKRDERADPLNRDEILEVVESYLSRCSELMRYAKTLR